MTSQNISCLETVSFHSKTQLGPINTTFIETLGLSPVCHGSLLCRSVLDFLILSENPYCIPVIPYHSSRSCGGGSSCGSGSRGSSCGGGGGSHGSSCCVGSRGSSCGVGSCGSSCGVGSSFATGGNDDR